MSSSPFYKAHLEFGTLSDYFFLQQQRSFLADERLELSNLRQKPR